MRRRISLRRKTLLIVLALAFLPSLITLIVTYATGVTAIRSYIIDQSRARLGELAQRIGDRILPATIWLREMSEDPAFVAAVSEYERNTGSSEGFAEVATAELLREAPHYLVLGGEIHGPILGAFPEEDEAKLRSIRDALAHAIASDPDDAICGVEIELASPKEIEFWLLGRIEVPGRNRSEAPWIVRRVDVSDLEGTFGGEQSIGQERVHILSTRYGAIGRSAFSDTLDTLLQEQRPLFRQPEGVIPTSNGDYWVFLRTGAVSGLTRPTGRESSWILLQRVSTDSATAALSYGIWSVALFGVVFVAFIGALGIWLSVKMVEPIRQLRAGFRRFELGELEYRLDMRTHDELQELAESANRMAETLQKSYQTLADKLLQLDDKAQQLSITYEVAKAVNRSLDLGIIFRNITEQIQSVIPSERICFGVVSEDRKLLEMAWSSPALDSGVHSKIVIQDSLVQQALETGEPTVFVLRPKGERQLEKLLNPETPKHLCVVPLMTTGGPVGVLLLEDQLEDGFRTQDVEILRRISENIAIAVEHSHLYQQQARFADELENLVRDRTSELERAQQQLIQTEKLAAAGEIAANVAHEINNPLSIIKNYIKLLQSQMLTAKTSSQDSEMSREGLRIIGEEIERIARIVDQLRKVNVPQQPQITVVDINKEMRQMVELFRHTFQQKKLELRTEFDERIGEAMTCNDYLRQIVINFLRNANDACKSGGKIQTKTMVQGDGSEFSVSVEDDGHGIRKEHLEKIFDPFFTTKKEGHGTGLGLSVSYGLARNMGGTIQVKSEPEKGTIMTLVLPLTRPSDSDVVNTSDGERDPIQRKGHQIIIG